MSFKEHWHKFEHWGQQHPVLLGIGIVIVGGIILWMFLPSAEPAPSGGIIAQPQGPSDAYYGYQASLAEQANRLQVAQLESTTAIDLAGKELTAAQTRIAGDVTIATLGYQTQGHIAELQQVADLTQISATARSQDLLSTLSAQTQQAGFNRDISVAGINAAAVTDVTRINADRDLGITAYQAQVASSNILAQLQGLYDSNATQLALGQIAGNAYLTGKALDIAGQNPMSRTLYSWGGGSLSGYTSFNPPAIENVPYRELFERSNEDSAQGRAIRQYMGLA